MTSQWTWHGGGLAAARAYFGEGDAPWLDLSTGINPHGWPGASAITVDWQRLPEAGRIAGLEAAAADHFGVPADHVCAVPGSEMGLRIVGALLPGPARHVTPSYRSHGAMVSGSAAITCDALDAADGETLILANPNNPDGVLKPRHEMLDLLPRRAPDGWLLVDEAFADCAPDASIVDQIGHDTRLVVFRSFGKFFGLAGLRLGFVLGPRDLLARLRKAIGSWPVSAAAVAIGSAAYRDTAWIAQTRQRLAAEAAALDATLALIGIAATGACPLFRLIAVDDAMATFARLASRAILTRPFEGQPHWLRIGLPPDGEALARLEAALRDG